MGELKIISLRDVWKANQRIRQIVQQTPLLYSQPLSEKTGARIYLKLENLQLTGSFKIRGATNKLLSLHDEQQKRGITTFSTGNHGIAVSYVAKQLHIPVTVCISHRVPTEKVNKLKALGANVKVVGQSQDEAAAYCEELVRKEGLTIIEPFDDPQVIAGQATIGKEIIEECPQVDQVVIPLSGGGLLSGIAFFLKKMDPSIQITGVSMESSAVMHESLKQGKPVELNECQTLADSLLGGIGKENSYTFSMTRNYINESFLVSETAIARGILAMLDYHKMLVEGAAGIGIGWLLEESNLQGKRIVVVISGNNIGSSKIQALLDLNL